MVDHRDRTEALGQAFGRDRRRGRRRRQALGSDDVVGWCAHEGAPATSAASAAGLTAPTATLPSSSTSTVNSVVEITWALVEPTGMRSAPPSNGPSCEGMLAPEMIAAVVQSLPTVV